MGRRALRGADAWAVLGTAEGWPWLAAEWRLEAQPIDLGDDSQLLLRGRADLLLGQTASAPPRSKFLSSGSSISRPATRTRSSKALGEGEQRLEKVRRKVLKGDALQLSLYAHAAKQLGARKRPRQSGFSRSREGRAAARARRLSSSASTLFRSWRACRRQAFSVSRAAAQRLFFHAPYPTRHPRDRS